MGGHSAARAPRYHILCYDDPYYAHAGVGLYGISKGLGQEIARVFSLHFPIHVIAHLCEYCYGSRCVVYDACGINRPF